MADRSVAVSLRLLSLAYFSMGTGSLAVVGALPSIASSLALNRGAVAMLVSAFAITFALAAPILQMTLGRWQRRTLILTGLALMAIGAAASALAPNYAVLLGARIVAGLGAAAIGPVASALGASLAPPRDQGRALAIVFSGMTISSVVGVPLSAWLGEAVGWRPMFAIIGLLTVAAALLVAHHVRDRGAGQRVRLAQLADILRRPATAGGIAVMVLEMAGMFSTYTMIAPILRDHFGASPEATSFALMTLGVAGVAGNFLARKIAGIWSADRAVAVALFGLIVVFAALYAAPAWYPAAIALIIVWALASDLFMPSQQRRMVELAPEVHGLVLALNSSAIYVGMATGSFVAGGLYPLFGLSALPPASVAFLTCGLGALWLSRRAAAAKPELCAASA
ncbi:MFS transporter [Methylocapsa sp. S129]|uniref:MFS transporter n=1 Tax=Methylocapsa sp. S129 TaxID=1641869 RepID=UPI00131BEF2D|nr:MFS transporter [Methylocapsa sp. S129]